MSDTLFLKLGGSLITDKTRPQALRTGVLARLTQEIAEARSAQPGLRLLLGHGSGSFGHVTARQYGTRAGVRTPEQWRGFAETGRIASELNRLVVDALWTAGVPALRVQPSASAQCHDGELRSLAERPVVEAIERGLVPVVHGDVAFDEVRGGTIISTEEIFAYLSPRMRPAAHHSCWRGRGRVDRRPGERDHRLGDPTDLRREFRGGGRRARRVAWRRRNGRHGCESSEDVGCGAVQPWVGRNSHRFRIGSGPGPGCAAAG